MTASSIDKDEGMLLTVLDDVSPAGKLYVPDMTRFHSVT